MAYTVLSDAHMNKPSQLQNRRAFQNKNSTAFLTFTDGPDVPIFRLGPRPQHLSQLMIIHNYN